MDFELKGKVALVTGAGSPIGFGRAIAITLAGEGCDVIANDINLEQAEETVKEIRKPGCRGLAIKADVSKSNEVKSMFEKAMSEFGRIDILVNNAGAASAVGPFVEQREEDWEKDINLNLKGYMLCARAVLPQMLARKYGKIINISSGTAKMGAPTFEAYVATKAGIGGLTKSLALEYATFGINVNCVAPGAAKTNFGSGHDKMSMKNQHEDMVKNMVPQKRPTLPQDVANMVAFLASDVSANIIGQMFSVDGGLTMTS